MTVRGQNLRAWAPALVLLIALAVLSALVIPRAQAHGSAVITTYDLDRTQSTPGQSLRGSIRPGIFGLDVAPNSTGTATFTASPAAPPPGRRTTVTISAGGGPGVTTRVTLVDGSGARHLLGSPERWQRHRIDVTSLRGDGAGRLEFTATNGTSEPQLVADQVVVATYPPDAIPRAGRWEVAAWVALLVLVVLLLLRRARRDAPLVIATGLTAFLVWPDVVAGALEPLPSDVWQPSVDAKWFDLDRGLLSGTFGAVSHLAVHLFHTLSPITGTGAAGARAASMLVGVGAVVAIYVLARRIGGLAGAALAIACALLTDPFRLSLSTGNSTSTLVLAACGFLLAVHYLLQRRDRTAMVVLGAVGAVAILADPTWWPGVIAAILLLALKELPSGRRRAGLVAGLAALAIVTLPSRVSVADQYSGDMTADVTLRTTQMRNLEFIGAGHSAPPTRAAYEADPFSGQRVGLGSYVFGDHSLSVVLGGTLGGVYDGLAAQADRPETGLAGLLAFILQIVGVIFLLALPRLRLLVLVPALVALVPWFLADRAEVSQFLAQAAFWPGMLAGVAALGYAGWQIARRRVPVDRWFAEAREHAPLLGRHAERSQEPASP